MIPFDFPRSSKPAAPNREKSTPPPLRPPGKKIKGEKNTFPSAYQNEIYKSAVVNIKLN